MFTVLAGFLAGVVSVQMLAPELLNAQERRRLPERLAVRMVAAGDFIGVDSVRRASGRAQLLDAGAMQILRFTEFQVSNAPHLEVWLSQNDAVFGSFDVRAAEVLPLSPLKDSRGDQVYLLPEGLDLNQYRSVLIWSPEFRVLYGVANLGT
ncbi:MAG: DM13 domain-containing protein [Pseudomonadota bacterium]